MSINTVEIRAFSGPATVELAGVGVPEIVEVRQGPQGPQGIQGATGATGPQGPAGPNTVTSATTSDGTADLSVADITSGFYRFPTQTSADNFDIAPVIIVPDFSGQTTTANIEAIYTLPLYPLSDGVAYLATTTNADGTIVIDSNTETTFAADSVLASDGTNVKAIETSSGGAGAADGGKIVLYDNAGNITGNNIFADESFSSQSFKVRSIDGLYFSDILGSNITANRSVELPDKDGTIAFTDDIPTLGTGVATALAIDANATGGFVTTAGNVATATALQTARTINGVSFNGTANITITVPVSTGITGMGTGVATALAVNVGSTGAFVVNGGALGTPSSGTLTSCTGLPISTGVSGLASGIATFLATPSSANLAAAVTDETGTGSLVFANSPTITTPTIAQINVASSLLILGAGAAGLFGLRSNSATGYSSLELLNSGGTQMGGFGYANASAGAYADQVYFYSAGKALILASAAGSRHVFLSTTGDVSIGSGAAANTRAVLDLTSTTKGFLPPRMTTTQRDAITSVPAGLMIYNTTTNKLNFYNGSAWEAVTSA